VAIRRRLAVLYLLVVFVIAFTATVSRRQARPSPSAAVVTAAVQSNTPTKLTSASPRLVSSRMAHIPLSFEEARGAAAGAGREFISRGPSYALALGRDGAVLTHRAKIQAGSNGDFVSSMASFGRSTQNVSSEVRLTWLDANPNARAEGADRQSGTSNYILGNNPKKWRTNVPHFGKVRFSSLYRGIDLVYHGNQDRVEMDYVVAPKAAPGEIRIGIGGPSLVAINPQGDLSISSAGDEVLLRAPVAYQEIEGKRQIVDAHYVLQGSHTVGFAIGAYDATQPLIIDPVLDYAASFGGGDDTIADVVTDTNGNVYVTGTTCSDSYPGPAARCSRRAVRRPRSPAMT
jgi:beta-propeller repeat-containing protein